MPTGDYNLDLVSLLNELSSSLDRLPANSFPVSRNQGSAMHSTADFSANAVDTSLFLYDASNDRVGSITTNPDYDFRVQSSTQLNFQFDNRNASIEYDQNNDEFVLRHNDGRVLSLSKMATQIDTLTKSFEVLSQQLHKVLPVLHGVAELYQRQASRMRIEDDT